VAAPAREIYQQGLSPRCWALSIFLGTTLGMFPLPGSTSVLCVLAIGGCKTYSVEISAALVMLINLVLGPVDILTWPLFMRWGCGLASDPCYDALDPTALRAALGEGFGSLLAAYGRAIVLGIAAWGATTAALFCVLLLALPLLSGGKSATAKKAR